MKNRVSTDGKSLELLVSRIYESLKDNPSVEVIRNVKLKNKVSGGLSEFDVIIKTKSMGLDMVTAIECKDYGARVSVSKIRDFQSKCSEVGGIHRKVFVAVNGYQSGVKGIAEHHDIELYDLQEISAQVLESWIAVDSIRFAYYDKKQFVGLIFYVQDGERLDLTFDEVDERAELCNAGQFIGYLGETVVSSVRELYGRKGREIDDWANTEFHKLTIAEDDIELTVPFAVSLDYSGKSVVIQWDTTTIPLQRLDIIIEYVYRVHTTSDIVARSYQKGAGERTAEIISGVTGRLSFEIIKSLEHNMIYVCAILPSGDIINMERTS